MSKTTKRLEALTADLTQAADQASVSQLVPDATPPSSPDMTIPATDPSTVMANNLAEVETRFPPALPGQNSPKTGPGQMLAFRGQMMAAEGELARLRERLAHYDGSIPARRLDPTTVRPSRWANRHEASYTSASFAGLKADIELAGGNVQPILVRPVEGESGAYEIVFGHRRHRACLELGVPVLAVVWTEALTDAELFAAMDRENRERADLSPYEQGMMYRRALDEGLYPSQRRLAEALGVSHTWVRKALLVAELPQPVLECFRSPIEIQYRHAEQIGAALETDKRGVLRRAERLRAQNLAVGSVVAQLIEGRAPQRDAAAEIRLDDQLIGTWIRERNGGLNIRLKPQAVPDDRIEALTDAIVRALRAS